MTSRIRQGIAPCRGIAEAFELVVFFLIFGPAIVMALGATEPRLQSSGYLCCYFLNKLSNAARASLALRGADMDPFIGDCETVPVGATSRATVTRGANRLQELS